MILSELIRSHVEPDKKTSKFYLGNTVYTLHKVMEMSQPAVIAVIVIAVFGRAIYQNPTDADLIQRGLLSGGIFVVVMLVSGLFFPSYLYPEFALTKDGLWFRYLRRWHFLLWSDIQTVKPAKSRANQLGILIYSEKLPRSFSGNARVYGGWSKGKAIVVFNLLPKIRELQTEIEAHLLSVKE